MYCDSCGVFVDCVTQHVFDKLGELFPRMLRQPDKAFVFRHSVTRPNDIETANESQGDMSIMLGSGPIA